MTPGQPPVTAQNTPGQIACGAYVAHCGGKSVHGEDLPSWEDQDPVIREHWEAAAQAVLDSTVPEMTQ